MKFTLPKLPYEMDTLAPHMSKETLEYHYGKHHKTYVETLNKLVEGKPEAHRSLEELIRVSSGPVFNNAAQHWNHSFFWNCLSPHAGGAPKGRMAEAIKRNFGSFADFKDKFTNTATKLFGSGYTWLVRKPNGELAIQPTHDADNPLREGNAPLLTLDVWEHAYYIDYRNARPKYVEGFWKLANWEFVESCLEKPVTSLHVGS